jgi:hypothetical protein
MRTNTEDQQDSSPTVLLSQASESTRDPAVVASHGIHQDNIAAHEIVQPLANAKQKDDGLSSTHGSEPFSWEMIGLGLDEPLPASDVINEL